MQNTPREVIVANLALIVFWVLPGLVIIGARNRVSRTRQVPLQ